MKGEQMRQLKNITKRKKFKHFTEKERYVLEALLEQKIIVFEISKQLGKDRSSVYREIGRGQIKYLTSELAERVRYRANVAQRRYEEKVSNRERSLKISNDYELERYITEKIKKERYSPDALLGEIKTKGIYFKTTICTKTLYNYIDRGILYKIRNADLLEKGRRKKKKPGKIKISLRNRTGLNISERPSEVEKREEYGHWEIDCVKSGKNKGKVSLLTLTERKTREEIIKKIPATTQEAVDKVLSGLEYKYKDKFKDKFKSITADNGSEFLDWETLESSKLYQDKKRTIMYFANPYSSWERGSNENQNRMIRRFIPKGSDISKVSEETIKEIETWMNNYPRKILGYKSANALVEELTAA